MENSLAQMPLRIIAEPMIGGELRPGDLFSTVGPEYWDLQTRNAIGERVYIRTNTPTPPSQYHEPIYRITIVRDEVTSPDVLAETMALSNQMHVAIYGVRPYPPVKEAK